MNIVLAILLGGAFGFALDRAKASNPQKIINMLRLKDFYLMKVILFAIGFSSFLLFILSAAGLIDAGHFNVKSATTGVIIGGAILGTGFAIGGYCPGTCIVASASGRKDSIFFILGGLIGALLFTLIFGFIKDTGLFGKIAGGEISLAATNADKYAAVIGGTTGTVTALIISLLFMIIAWKLPDK